MAHITADQWKAAALTAFRRTLSDLTGVKLFKINTSLHGHRTTAAVSWRITEDPKTGKPGALDVQLFLPVMRPGVRLTRRDADALAGYWVHEACHVLFSDMVAWRNACQRSDAFRHVVNALEDVRIEKALLDAAKVPGASAVLHAIVERACWPSDVPVTPATVNAKAGLAGLLAYLGRARCNGFTLSRAAAMQAALTPANRALVDRVLAATMSATSTSDIVAIVDALFSGGNVIDAPPAPALPDDVPGDMGDQDPEDLSDLADNTKDGEGQPDHDATEDLGDDAEDDAEDGEGQDGEGEGQSQPSGKTTAPHSGHGNGKDDDGDLSTITEGDDVTSAEPDQAAQDLADALNGAPLTWNERELLDAGDMNRHALTETHVTFNGKGAEVFADLEGVGALRIAVRRLVVSPERFGWTRHLERGRIDPANLHRARLGQRDVFRRVDHQEGHRAAVSLVLDMSGSMGANSVPQAVMAYHIASAVEAAGAPVAVSGFTGARTLSRVKGYHEKVRAVTKRFLAAAHAPGSCTPLAPSILQAARDLANVDATARVLVVLTDGEDDTGRDRVATAIRMSQGLGITVVAVVISRADVPPARYGFDVADAALVAWPGDLSGAVMGQLVKQLDAPRSKRVAA